MRIRPLLTLISTLPVATLLAAPPLYADSPLPVRLQIAGMELRGAAPALFDGKETYAPLEVLSAVGLEVEKTPRKQGAVVVTDPDSGKRSELRLTKRAGKSLLPLSEVARLVEGDVERPARLDKDGTPVPAKPGDWVYLLARVRSVQVTEGTVRIDTTFPVPVRNAPLEDETALQVTVECVGAAVPESFSPAPLPPDERRVRAVAVSQARVDVVRVTLDLAAPPAGACAEPGEPAGAQAEPLLLDDVLRQVQGNYPKLSAADAERRTAAAKLREKQGFFDPVLTGGSEFTRFPDSDKLGALKSFSATFAGVEFLTPYGIKVITGGRRHDGSVKSPLSPTGSTGEYFVGVKLPLLAGAGINEKSAALRQSRLGVPLADSEFDLTRIEVLLKAANVYWDWVAAGRRVDVARNLLGLARVRAQAVRERAELGDLPLIDVTEANQEVQRRIEGLQKSEREWQKETFKLSVFLWNADGTPMPLPTLANLPPATPPAGALEDERVEDGRSLALERRPELQALTLAQRFTRVSLDLARNQRLPAIDLSLAPGVDTGFGGAGGTLKAGVSVGLPLRQRTAEGRIQEARLKLEKLELDQQLERQRIVTEVADAASAVRQAYQRYVAAAEELSLARRLEQGERDRFDLGDSTLFLVNQRERATAEAAVKVITIQAEYEQALALFRAVTAQI